MDSFSCECLLFMSRKGVIKSQSRSHNARTFTKGKIFCFKIFATCHYFCHCISTDASNTEMANKKTKQNKKQSKIKP